MGESTITTAFLVLTLSCAILAQEMIEQDDSSWFDQHNDVYAEHSVQNRTVDIRSDVIEKYRFLTDFIFSARRLSGSPKISGSATATSAGAASTSTCPRRTTLCSRSSSTAARRPMSPSCWRIELETILHEFWCFTIRKKACAFTSRTLAFKTLT